jgi:hypothetical protein
MAPQSFLSSDGSGAIYPPTGAGANTIMSLNSDGYTIGTSQFVNNSPSDYASWTFAKQEGFFDVVTYTGNSTAGREIPHNLGSTPGMIIVKCLTDTKNWRVYHTSLGADYWLELNETGDKVGPSAAIWNSTEPTSTVFTVGSSITINGSGQDYVAYVFANDAQEFGPDGNESIIKCGAINSTNYNGAEEDLGWEPQWILVKNQGDSNWEIIDNKRGASSAQSNLLYPNLSNTEVISSAVVKFTANGFTQYINATSNAGIYVAIRNPDWAANPFPLDHPKYDNVVLAAEFNGTLRDEISGSDIVDPDNAAAFVDAGPLWGNSKSALAFSKAARLDLPVSLPINNFTFSAWVFINQSPANTLFRFIGDANSAGTVFMQHNGSRFQIALSYTSSDNPTITFKNVANSNVGAWNYIVVSCNPSDRTYSVNCSHQTSYQSNFQTSGNVGTSSSGPVAFMGYPTAVPPFKVRDFRMYDTNLLESDLHYLHEADWP